MKNKPNKENESKSKSKRIVACGDFHCGHAVGLTPPGFAVTNENDIYHHFEEMRKEIWKFYADTIKNLQPIDLLIVNGDCIDGKGERSGGTELIESDPSLQAKMAAECIKIANAKNIIMTFGTAYHTGRDSDQERQTADAVGAKIGSHEWVEVNGVMFDIKHHISSSIIPHGRVTPVSRDKLWNDIWSLDGGQPRADILLRSHVHYHTFSGDPDYLAMTLPALQGYGSKFGSRCCSGKVHVGLISFDVDSKGGYSWQQHILRGEFLKAKAIKI